tara:strand:+ start:735 stop:1586 length:852 start_codon:yes stop_codon:yes gene_type:complete
MSIAELHGKISSSGSNLSERLEDLLTSDVFGSLRYLPFEEALIPILENAQNYKSENTNLKIKHSVKENNPKIVFWYRLPHSEPDVLIKYGKHLILIEVKYLHGKSGRYLDSNQQEENIVQEASSDQLGREFEDLLEYKKDDFIDRSLVYITAHRIIPTTDFEEVEKHFEEKEHKNPNFPKVKGEQFKRNAFWLSWIQIHNVLVKLSKEQPDEFRKEILDDIKKLLFKKGLRRFNSFMELNNPNVTKCETNIFYQQRVRTYFHDVIPNVSEIEGDICYSGVRNG